MAAGGRGWQDRGPAGIRPRAPQSHVSEGIAFGSKENEDVHHENPNAAHCRAARFGLSVPCASLQRGRDPSRRRGSRSPFHARGGKAGSRHLRDDIDAVYATLLCGSRNHLRAFAQNIETLTTKPYVAQLLSQEEVDAIIDTPMEKCNSKNAVDVCRGRCLGWTK
jgi:hypothetical protein